LKFEQKHYHPSYKALKEKLQNFEAIYKGGEPAKVLLRKFSKEPNDAYQDRQAVTAFPKLCARVLSVYATHLFSEKPERSIPDGLQAYVGDIDGDGTNIDALLAEQYTDIALPFGLVYFLVTKQTASDEIETLAQEKEAGLRPLVVPFSPLDLLKWDFDERGQLKHIVLQDGRTQSGDFNEEHTSYDLLRIWKKDSWAIYKRSKATMTKKRIGFLMTPGITI
jgi:hypothetical protein